MSPHCSSCHLTRLWPFPDSEGGVAVPVVVVPAVLLFRPASWASVSLKLWEVHASVGHLPPVLINSGVPVSAAVPLPVPESGVGVLGKPGTPTCC